MIVATGSLVSSLVASDGVWDVTKTGALNWVDSLNWNGGVVPGLPGGSGTINDKATFNAVGAATTISIDAGRTVKFLEFGTGATNYTIGGAGANLGEALTITSGGSVTLATGATTSVLFNAPIILQAGSYTFTNNSLVGTGATTTAQAEGAAKLNFAGNISGGTATSPITLTLAGQVGTRNAGNSASAVLQANNISGVISNGAAGGVLSIAVSGVNNGSNAINAWNLTGANTYSGSTTISGNSTLYVNNLADTGLASSLGTGVNGSIVVSGYLMYTGGVASTNRSFTGAGGNIYNNGTGMLTLSGTVAINNGSSIIFRGSQTIAMSGLISGGIVGNVASVSKTNGNTLVLTNNSNSFNGNLSISAGTVSVTSVANAGSVSAIGAGSTIAFGQNQVGDNVGTLQFTGASGGSTNRAMVINSGSANTSGARGTAIIENTVAGQTLTMSGNLRTSGSVIAAADYFSAFTMTGAGNGVMSGVVGGLNGGGLDNTLVNLLVTKSGAGTWELQGNNRYYGATNTTAGTLLVTNTAGSGTGTGNVTTSGSATLGGTGFITSAENGSITIAAGTSLMVGNTHGVAAGQAGSNGYLGAASQLSIGTNANVAITLAGTMRFDLFGNDAGNTFAEADRLKVSTTATSLTVGGAVAVEDTTSTKSWRSNGGGGWTSGTWQLVDWSSASSATRNGTVTYSLPTSSVGIGYTWDTSNFLIDGTVSVVKIADANIHIWTGATSNSWSTAGNWTANTALTSSSDVIFDTSTVLSSNIDGDKTVRNILFTGATSNTVNTGSGGVLYLGGDAANGGTIQVQGGTQTFNANVRVGINSPNVYIVNQGTLNFTGEFMANDWSGTPTNKVVTFSGDGSTNVASLSRRHNTYDMSIVKNGAGTLTIQGSNGADAGANAAGTITGTTTINGGKIRINNERSLGGNPGAFNAAHLTLNGGVLGAFGTFAIDDVNRGITLGANGGGIDVEGANTLTVASTVTGSGALAKTGTGVLVMSAANTYSGNTTISAGTYFARNTTGSATGTGSVFTTGTATLGGTGAITASAGKTISIAAGTKLMVGDTHGVAGVAQDLLLGMSGNVSINLNGTLQFDLFGAGSTASIGDSSYNLLGTANDLLEIDTTGTLSLDNLIVQLSTLDTSGWLDGQTWKLIDWSNSTPSSISQQNVTLGTTTLGGYTLTQTITSDGYYVTAAIPEPSRVVLLMFGLAGLIMHRRRR